MGIDQLILSNGHSASHNSYLGGNAFEALVGAIYLDKGYKGCMDFMQQRILGKMINIDKLAYKEVNFKSKLLEWSQKNRVNVSFELLSQKVDSNGSPMFDYRVVIEGVNGCNGQGYSKKESQQLASKLTLEKLRREPQFIDQIFAAKTNRTKMEEEPVETVPDTAEKQDFIIAVESAPAEPRQRKPRKPAVSKEQPAKEAADDSDEFDLSDISARAMSREEIIAAAEAEAFGGE